jgi:hypothetical protein
VIVSRVAGNSLVQGMPLGPVPSILCDGTCHTKPLYLTCNNLVKDTAGKLPAGRFGGLRPPRTFISLLVFASCAGKNEQRKRNSAEPAAPAAPAGE